jgi:hypothetical protein
LPPQSKPTAEARSSLRRHRKTQTSPQASTRFRAEAYALTPSPASFSGRGVTGTREATIPEKRGDSVKPRKPVPNRIFLAYQWKDYRETYEEACASLHRQFPLYFYALGRPKGEPAQQLMEKIVTVMSRSTSAVFDASKGSPNVSLEYGMATTMGIKSFLLIDEHTLPGSVTPGTAIISDLAGSMENRWDVKDASTLKVHLSAIATDHEYTKRFRRYCRDRRLVAGQFRQPLKVIRLFDEREAILRREVLDELRGTWPGKKVSEIEKLIGDMHAAGLITITPGREWASKVFIA